MRRNRAPKREIAPDVRYNSVQVQSFINRVMKSGKKSVATRVVYDALDIMQERSGQDALEMFEKAIENSSPIMEVKPRRIGGATYQVPMEVPHHRQFALATRWLLGATRGRSGKSFPELLADELLDAANNTGSAVRKREESHRMAKANRAFSHFRV
ncbi:MAG: 30S ribosomal protein S7 [Anaerolineales bacterium]|nr:30S ribosomal protein S7 [Chloroflexota bacterium]MBL6981173.1 30S ribosomal protein S7 [Anaerolineales bacterium]